MVEIGVTPCMGVWIETHLQVYGDGQQESHPVWVCGLKLGCTALAAGLTWSHPVWVCGLKRHRLRSTRWLYWSHPVWVCGLKLQSAVGHVLVSGHTLYGCVDWNLSKSSMNEDKAVTPCMGVWIETSVSVSLSSLHSVTPCMGVWIETPPQPWLHWQRYVTPCMGVWIETTISRRLSHRWRTFTVIPCMGVWIETPEINLSHSLKTYRVSSLRSNFNSLF